MADIHECARLGDLEGVLVALAAGVDVEARLPRSGRTALMEAVMGGARNFEVVRLLLSRGADANAVAVEKMVSGTDVDLLEEWAAGAPDVLKAVPGLEDILSNLKGQPTCSENVLSLAVRAGHLDTVRMLLAAGADVRYRTSSGYTPLVNVMYGRDIADDSELLDLVRLLIDHGAEVNGETDYGETPLSVASNFGRFDVVRLLLDAGADAEALGWTGLMRAVALGSLEDVEAELRKGADVGSRDGWSRTAWLLSLQVGDVEKARRLLAAGADRRDRGRCGKTALMFAVETNAPEMLRWLLAEGFDPNEEDEFGRTALIEAAGRGAAASVRLLLEAGADTEHACNGEKAIGAASSLEVVKLLVSHGANLQEISDEMRWALTGVAGDGRIDAPEEAYAAAKHRRFGKKNPELMNEPFWESMVRSGASAYAARERFRESADTRPAVWCFKRFGKTLTPLPDGRIVEIAGEHEDHYDPDFCIYNDVVVHHPGGRIDIYGYPKETFPPTDFHTATLVGTQIYIIGSLGYGGERAYGVTPVYRLDVESFAMEKVETRGEMPGWIHRHRAVLATNGAEIRISGGQVCVEEGGKEELREQQGEYALALATGIWRRV